MSARRTRPRGFADWNPRPDTMALVAQVQGVLDEYAAHLPLTVRQVFYRLVGTQGFRQDRARLCAAVRDGGPRAPGRAVALRGFP